MKFWVLPTGGEWSVLPYDPTKGWELKWFWGAVGFGWVGSTPKQLGQLRCESVF